MKNFAQFFSAIYRDYSRKHKTPLATEFDEQYGRRLLEKFGKKTLLQITPRMIENYLVELQQTETRFGRKHSPVTVRRHYDMLNQVFNMAIRERVINDTPCRLVGHNVLKNFPTWQKHSRLRSRHLGGDGRSS